jgi:hypothetical protein
VYTAHVYRDDVTFDLGRYYIYELGGEISNYCTLAFYTLPLFPSSSFLLTLKNVNIVIGAHEVSIALVGIFQTFSQPSIVNLYIKN